MNTNEIKIIGIDKVGQEVLERISFQSIENTDYTVCDINAENLAKSSVGHKILFGTGIVKRLSIQDQIKIGMDAVVNSEVELVTNLAIDAFDQFDSLFGQESKMVILITNLADTTGAGATPVIAQIAKKRGLFVVAIVYTPFDFEGEIRKEIANKSLKKLREDCDFVLIVKYSKIGKLYGNLGFKTSFGKADDIIIRLARIVLLMESINPYKLDTILFFKKNQDNKPFYIGIGDGNGTNRAKDAIELALKNTLSEREVIEGATNVLLQIKCGKIKMTINEMREIDKIILNTMRNKGTITISTLEDVLLDDALSVLIVAY